MYSTKPTQWYWISTDVELRIQSYVGEMCAISVCVYVNMAMIMWWEDIFYQQPTPQSLLLYY